jgi:hypothetical protein
MLRSAAKAGVKPLEFWEMTPLELAVTIDAYVEKETANFEQGITLAYMGAAWQRAKKMPRLETVLNKIKNTTQRKNKKAQTPVEMMAVFKSMSVK